MIGFSKEALVKVSVNPSGFGMIWNGEILRLLRLTWRSETKFFYLAPLKIKFRHRTRKIELEKIHKPLSFTMDYASSLWREQINSVKKQDPAIVSWCFEEICRIVKDHLKESRIPHIQEPDLLRASGPLKHLGMQIGGYVGKGYDCLTQFKFLDYPAYSVPLEIKRDSAGFKYQQQKYGKDELSRAVVLCAVHGHKTMPPHIDVIELEAICKQAGKFL